MKAINREALLSFWKVHILHHARTKAVNGQWIPTKLRRHGFWGFALAKQPHYGLLSMIHEARTDLSMLLGLLLLLIAGAGAWSVDARIWGKAVAKEKT